MLVGFRCSIAFINAVIVKVLIGISFQEILGYVFAPFAFIWVCLGMNVNAWKEREKNIYGNKISNANEFVRYDRFSTRKL